VHRFFLALLANETSLPMEKAASTLNGIGETNSLIALELQRNSFLFWQSKEKHNLTSYPLLDHATDTKQDSRA